MRQEHAKTELHDGVMQKHTKTELHKGVRQKHTQRSENYTKVRAIETYEDKTTQRCETELYEGASYRNTQRQNYTKVSDRTTRMCEL